MEAEALSHEEHLSGDLASRLRIFRLPNPDPDALAEAGSGQDANTPQSAAIADEPLMHKGVI
jgi:hypothetical protein